MDLYQLECFRVVARLEHISNAANELHITQPALSKIISRVEEFAGAPLFDRVKGKIKVNQNGRVFLETLDQVFLIMNQGLEKLQSLSAAENSQIRVASSTDGIFFHIRDQLREQHPDFRVRYSVMNLHQIRDAFISGTLDFALTDVPLNNAATTWEFISEEEIYLIVHQGHRFWEKISIPFQALQEEEIICEAVGDPIREIIDRCCITAGFQPNVVLESTIGLGGLQDSSALQDTVSFMPAHRFMQVLQSRREAMNKIHAIRLTDPICTRKTGIVYRSDLSMNSACKTFRVFALDYFTQLDQQVRSFAEDYFLSR